MTLARFDLSFADAAYHQPALDNLREASRRTGRLCAVVMDTLGPEVVVPNPAGAQIALEAGSAIELTCDAGVAASARALPVSLPSLHDAGLQAGANVFVGQYLFTGSETTSAYLTVQSVAPDGRSAACLVNNACVLEGAQLTVQFAATSAAAPILSARDELALRDFGARNAVDFVALSFTRSAADVAAARARLDALGMRTTKLIAKIECREGLAAHKEILAAADAVVLSRGSMGNCLDPEKMALAQKALLAEANLAGVPVFATRVVDTMTEAPRPTRAEATDVANLVLDGADGIVLGSETFRGKFPVAAAEVVLAIARQAEHCYDSYRYYQHVTDRLGINAADAVMSDKTEALATAAVRAATKLRAALIVVFTATGRTARLIAKYRPHQPVLTVVVPGLTSDGLRWRCSGDYVARQCLQLRGVLPICADASVGGPDGAVLTAALKVARERGLTRPGDRVVVSQCPRASARFAAAGMAEAGVVRILTLGADGVATRRACAVLDASGRAVVGSREEEDAAELTDLV